MSLIIRASAEKIYATLAMRDFARIDGWYLDSGAILFSDVNPISGMEQNSFLFQQGARAGFSHAGLLRHIVRTACRRSGLPLPMPAIASIAGKKRIAVLFGGASSERQVSLMSGTNVWMKLRASHIYQPEPYLLTGDHDVWRVSYAAALNHTVEEVRAVCEAESTPKISAQLATYRMQIRSALGIADQPYDELVIAPPSCRTLAEFLDQESSVFLALHGGIGEDGTLQAEFEKRGTHFNGSGSAASRLCMDKAATAEAIAGLAEQGITYPGKWTDTTQAWLERLDPQLWTELQQRLGTTVVVVKPRGDGCSTGVVPLTSDKELRTYLEYTAKNAPYVPDGVFALKRGRTELPRRLPEGLIFEAFVETDQVRVADNGQLLWDESTKWIEVTVGVLGHAGSMRALNPSLTIALDGVLSLEEKFMGGTGINLTPPPVPPLGRVAPAAIAAARNHVALIANTIGLNGYARIDAFMQIENGNIQLIEVNTLPGLTASTVLFHQGLAEQPSLPPVQLLEEIIRIMETTPQTRQPAKV
jgi:D-alanine-D-alanine ligase-like ATP-grasp enzyme